MTDTGNRQSSAGGKTIKSLGVFALAMINIAAVLTLRKFPPMAEYGWSSIGWCMLGAVFFLIPLSLSTAEMATGWPKGGGVYAWVREAFGESWGFFAVWCEWAQNLVWFPTVLSFIASSFAFAINPDLANNGWFLFTVMMTAFWGCTIVNIFGQKVAGKFNNIGVVIGTVIPAFFMIVLGIAYPLLGNTIQIPFSPSALLPQLNFSTLPFVATVVMLFFGMEMAGYHAMETRNPSRDFPRAILLSASFILAVTLACTLAIAFVVPQNNISFSAGIMQAFQVFLDTFHLAWLIGPIAVLITVGALAQLATWMAGPAKGLGAVALRGNLPPVFRYQNRHGSPTAVLLIQGVIGTVISMLFLFVPNASSAYWFLTAMMVQLLCITYFLMFAAVIRLRYTQPQTPRAYRIPGGRTGVWIVSVSGCLACLYTIAMSFLPPTAISHLNIWAYALPMLLGTAALAIPPFIFLKFKRPNWSSPSQDSNGTGTVDQQP